MHCAARRVPTCPNTGFQVKTTLSGPIHGTLLKRRLCRRTIEGKVHMSAHNASKSIVFIAWATLAAPCALAQGFAISAPSASQATRSEEHTSELQSLRH